MMENEGGRVLVIGGGARESSLAWKLSLSPAVSWLAVAPGNPFTRTLPKTTNNSALDLRSNLEVVKFCEENLVTLVVIGPEDPLARGLADSLVDAGVKVFGPKKDAARIETSKAWAKDFMRRHGIPTADFAVFTQFKEAAKFLASCPWKKGVAIKASGLAGGKGVTVTRDVATALNVLESTMLKKAKEEAAFSTIVLEERLLGFEISVLALSDGWNVRVLPAVQDHKQRFGGGIGPNTGGMGSYCPCPLASDEDLKEAIALGILQRAVRGMKSEGYPFIGALYAGIMMTEDGPKVLEFNCRFGDPETQVLMLLLESDLYASLKACAEGNLESTPVTFREDSSAICVSVVIESYPSSVKEGLGLQIKGIEDAKTDDRISVFLAGAKVDEKDPEVLLTAGGRVLSMCAIGKSLEEAYEVAYNGALKISFANAPLGFKADFRKDIGFQAIKKLNQDRNSKLSYKDSGVDIEAGNCLVEEVIKGLSQKTFRPGVRKDLFGLFGAAYDIALEGYDKNPLLISSTDGVGTKLKVAVDFGEQKTVGEDLVAMCVNDIIVHGAEPLFFLDYLSFSKVSVEAKRDLLGGVTNGCLLSNCSLIGGETAEMPRMYQEGEFDMAGFTVGVVNEEDLLPKRSMMKPGNVIIGVASSGLHSNGFSLIREVVERLDLSLHSPAPFNPEELLGKELLTPTVIYAPLLPVLREGSVLGAAHITGGGIVENLARVIPESLSGRVEVSWEVPRVFGWLAALGIKNEQLERTFNMGLGMILIVEERSAQSVVSSVERLLSSRFPAPFGESPIASVIGSLTPREDKNPVIIKGMEEALIKCGGALVDAIPAVIRNVPRKRVAVLISGTGTNLQALLDHTMRGLSVVDIGVVISNIAGVQGLARAEAASVPTVVIPHKDFGSRSDFESEMEKSLSFYNIDFVCLAGFMRILTGGFTGRWRGRLLNIHPSLLPSFKGKDAQKQALEARVCVTGCTVHFVSEEVDGGAVVAQEAVPVLPDDSVESLSQRIKLAEHKLYPRAMELVARGRVSLGDDGRILRL